MSSEDGFVALLLSIQTNLYRFGGPILMGLGSVSCIMSLLVFTKKNLRKNPCCIYFVACNLANLLHIFTSILLPVLTIGYNIDPTLYNLNLCRFRLYAVFLFEILSPSYLISASIDRILLTSRNARTRQRSTPRLAYICIASITLFWMLLHSHLLIQGNIVEPIPGFVLCYFQLGLQVTLINYYSLFTQRYSHSFVDDCSGFCGLWKIFEAWHGVTPASLASTSGTTTMGECAWCAFERPSTLFAFYLLISVSMLFSIWWLLLLLCMNRWNKICSKVVLKHKFKVFSLLWVCSALTFHSVLGVILISAHQKPFDRRSRILSCVNDIPSSPFTTIFIQYPSDEHSHVVLSSVFVYRRIKLFVVMTFCNCCSSFKCSSMFIEWSVWFWMKYICWLMFYNGQKIPYSALIMMKKYRREWESWWKPLHRVVHFDVSPAVNCSTLIWHHVSEILIVVFMGISSS